MGSPFPLRHSVGFVVAGLLLLVGGLPSSCAYPAPATVTIGVLLPLTGAQANKGLRMKVR